MARAAEVTEAYAALSAMEKVDIALPAITDIHEHDIEMDEISKQAMQSYKDMMSLGSNVTDMHAGKIYEVAIASLKTALDAKNSKAQHKLRIIELQLKKARLDQIANEEGGNSPGRGGEFDRNELMKHITEAGKADKGRQD